MKTTSWILAASAWAAGCSTAQPIVSPGASAASKEKETATKRAGLERDLALAREKVAKAERDLTDQQLSGTANLARAKGEHDIARARLQTLEEKEAPNRLAKARLDLQGARDNQEDAKEELEQLELMYKEQDLADKTREIVIRRSQRQLARAAERLKLQEEDLKILEERTLPQEREKAVFELDEKQRALGLAQRTQEAALHDKRIALMAAVGEAARLERELASLESEPKPAS